VSQLVLKGDQLSGKRFMPLQSSLEGLATKNWEAIKLARSLWPGETARGCDGVKGWYRFDGCNVHIGYFCNTLENLGGGKVGEWVVRNVCVSRKHLKAVF